MFVYYPILKYAKKCILWKHKEQQTDGPTGRKGSHHGNPEKDRQELDDHH